MHGPDPTLQTYQDHLALVNAIIPALSTADQVTVVSQIYSNAVNSYRDEYNEKYPRLCGRDWTYYLMKPQISIGRETDNLEQYQHPRHGGSSGSHATEIDLGPVKIVSRVHAIIKQDELNNKIWEIEVRGRNGAKVNGSKVKPKKSPLGRISLELNSGDIIEIAGIQMVFILPDRPPVISESCLFSLISKLMERRTSDNEFNVSTLSLQSILNRLGHSNISAELLHGVKEPTSVVATRQADGVPLEAPDLERTASGFQQEPIFVPTPELGLEPAPEPEPTLPPLPYPQETRAAVRTEETGDIQTSRPSLSIPSSRQYGKTLDVPAENSNIVSSIPLNILPTNPPTSNVTALDCFNVGDHDDNSNSNSNNDNNNNSNNYYHDGNNNNGNSNGVDNSNLRRRTVSRNPMLPAEKPPAPYSTLITQAILSKPYGVISVAEIYEFVYTNYDYFKRVKTGWRNSIRHNLSINPAFEKVPKSRTPFGGKGTVWRINKKYQDEFLRKWRDGTLALKNAKTISIDRQLQLYMSRHNKLPSLTDE